MTYTNEIAVAIISGVVALLVSGGAGIYTIVVARKKIDQLRKEVVAAQFSEHSAKEFIGAHREFLRRYDLYEAALREKITDPDGREQIQLIIDFHAESAQELVRKYGDFLGAEIESAELRMQRAIDELSKNFKPNDPSKLHYAADVQEAGFELHKLISQFRPR